LLVEWGLLALLGQAAPASFCQDHRSAQPARDLYCITLEPTPDLLEVAGVVTLGRAASPFGVAVTPAGVQRFDLTLVARNLPPPESLGARAYIAWVTTPTFDTMIRLGIVRNGTTPLGEVAFNKFLVLVSAENADTVHERRGRLVLRGGSPGTIMLPHGVNMLPPQPAADHSHQPGDGWTMPEAYPGVTPMVTGLERMRPRAAPYLPRETSTAVPAARPRELVKLENLDTLDLTAGLMRRSVAGRSIIMYGFNGQYPGPLIEVGRNTTVVVRFYNQLDQPSSVHWHGIRLLNRFDGVPGLTQAAVAPGSSFTYRIHFPDAGIYWYHPHVREETQQDLGLYGNLLVRSEEPDYYGPATREEILMLDDLLVGDEGLIPYGRERATHALMGRFGNLTLVNGEPDYRMESNAGEVTRIFLTNVSNVRTWNLSLPGARMKLIAGDVSRFEREEWVTNVAIAPAERYVVDVQFGEPGVYPLLNRVQALDHQTGVYLPETDTLARFTVKPAPRSLEPPEYEILRTTPDVAATLRDSLESVPAKTFLLTARITGDSLPFGLIQAMRLDTAYVNPVEWTGTMPMMDWLSTSGDVHWIIRDSASGRENMDIDWKVKRGTVARVRLLNDRHTLHAMQHPMHLHGQRFLVLAQNGVPTANLVWKDTALVPAGGTLDLLVEFSNPGSWMIHCHIAEHLEAGMHAMVVVE
jgi:FtsP/CotA-like multicopper oxidase with cupredoxin domain